LNRMARKAGFNTRPVTSPVVPVGKERLRFCIYADNTEEEILKLLSVIENFFIEDRRINDIQISKL
ncbi:13613_t:CDS:1, partial [Dentiscutata erythropus]